jgi:hypothetical protein
MNANRTSNFLTLLIKVGSIFVGFGLVLFNTFWELLTSLEIERHDDRQLLDTDLIGEYNHRTGRLDAGNDPYGWYGDD